FKGVLEFDNDQVPPLHSEEPKNSWSLVVVTLTAIVIALPNTANDHGEGLIASMREGLQIVRNIEECLNADSDLVKTRRAARQKREDSVRSAAQLLGRSRKILEILNTRQLPNLDVDSMADIGKWHALPRSETPNDAPLNQIHLAFLSANESVIVNIGV
nr:hypothetical protein CTI12_AA203530 [Tanacetum cinerariifolium]